jgi:hypothetical protein
MKWNKAPWVALALAALGGCSAASIDKAGHLAMHATGKAAVWGAGWSATATGLGGQKTRAVARLSPWARGGDGSGHEAVMGQARAWCELMGWGEPSELAYQEGWAAGPLGGAREARGDYVCAAKP